MAQIYSPREDSYLLEQVLTNYLSRKKNKKTIKYLDMGCGSGILSESASGIIPKENILSADINEEAVELMKDKEFNVIHSHLFSKVKGTFDVITFNAPYLPRDYGEPKDSQISTTGGKRGDEVSVKFLNQAKRHLKAGGKIFLLISSLTPRNRINEFKPKEVAKIRIFAEELIVLRIT